MFTSRKNPIRQTAMIISASRRTDISAFYSQWFMQRIRAGFFYRVNPFNSNQLSGFSLKPEDVNAICFWSKNPEPLTQYLDELEQRGFNYYFQFTLNPYGPEFEPHLPPLDQRIATFRELARRITPQRVVWRYDPVILTSVTPISWHLEQAEQLAGQLAGATCRMMFSFYDYYGKGQGRLEKALHDSAIRLEDITAPEKRAELHRLVSGFKRIAERYQLQIVTCCEDLDLSHFGIAHGACIDGDLIREQFGSVIAFNKDKNQRRACGCVESVDMGSYNSCRFRCRYCYANFNPGILESNCRRHDPESPLLLGGHQGELEIRRSLRRDRNNRGNCSQPLLFDGEAERE